MTERTAEEISELTAEYQRRKEARRRYKAQQKSQQRSGVVGPNKSGPVLPPSQVPPVSSGMEITAHIPTANSSVRTEAAPKSAKAKAKKAPKRRPEAVALEIALSPKFPGLKLSYYTLTEQDQEFVSQRLESLPGLIEALLDKFLTLPKERTGITLGLFSEGTTESGASKGVKLSVNAPQLDKNAPAFGLYQSYLQEDGKPVLYIESIVAPGRSKQFFRTVLLPQAAKHNIQKFALRASNLLVSGNTPHADGRTVWARYGFAPTPAYWSEMQAKGLSALKKKPFDAASSQVKDIMKDPSPKALRRLVFLAWQERKQAGKDGLIKDFLDNVVLGQPWDGDIDLNDSDSRQWLETYVAISKPEDHLGTFKRLVPPPTIVRGDYTFMG
jgi:hypothetical protein